MIPYQWTSAAIAIAIASAIIWLVRKHRLHPINAVSWIGLAIMMAVAGVAPGLVDSIAAWLGVHYPPILAVVVALALVLLKQLKGDIERSENQRQIRLLAQKIAILESRLESEKARHPHENFK